MLDHAEILRVKDIGAALVLNHREILTRTGLLDETVLPATRMGAGTPVRIAAGQEITEHAASGVGHAHRAMHEGLDVHLLRNMLTQFPDLVQAQLTCTDDSLRAELPPEEEGLPVRVVRLGRDV